MTMLQDAIEVFRRRLTGISAQPCQPIEVNRRLVAVFAAAFDNIDPVRCALIRAR
jgi:hypothetical protein